MKDKHKIKLALFLVAIASNIYNLSNCFDRGWITIGVFSFLSLGFFIYLSIQIIIESLKPEPKRVPCTYPTNEFYNFKDEVPDGTRVSTIDDCLGCNDMDCANSDAKYCLIGEANGI